MPNLNLSEKQVKAILSVLFGLVVLLGGALGYDVTIKPPPATPVPPVIGAESLMNTGVKCGAQTISGGTPVPCVEAHYGRGIAVYSADASGTATPVFSVDAAGNVYGAGNVTLGGATYGLTPVATATALSLYTHYETANTYLKCVDSNVTGSLTVTPVAGATPVGQPLVGLAQAPAGDAARAGGLYSTGVFTISVTNSALTPAPNTTPAAVKWCYWYNK